jgi:hypothetical protein
MGSKSRLLQTLIANGGANAVPTQGLKWRRGGHQTTNKSMILGAYKIVVTEGVTGKLAVVGSNAKDLMAHYLPSNT